MSIGEEQVECPLCMEPLEMDDINFYPCTCGYQICRFCWNRIRTDENGLCPACRKSYPEDPAAFKPLTEDELQRIKRERKMKDLQRKQKAAENRKHLANVRVVQKNLVFAVGLSQRLADTEVLKKHDYFGKFGKIVKVVINQSTSYAGSQCSQGPSASAYITYHKAEDALRAIQAVNNIHVDGRTIKASLGTTKYCSHFLRGTQCPKPDCMYLHELGDEAASFTKEEMQQGKHQEYEQKLYEQYMNHLNTINATSNHTSAASTHPSQSNPVKSNQTRKKTHSPATTQRQTPPQSASQNHTQNTEVWPSLHTGGQIQSKPSTTDSRTTNSSKGPPTTHSNHLSNSLGSLTTNTSSNGSCAGTTHKRNLSSDLQHSGGSSGSRGSQRQSRTPDPHTASRAQHSVTEGNCSQSQQLPLQPQHNPTVPPPPHQSNNSNHPSNNLPTQIAMVNNCTPPSQLSPPQIQTPPSSQLNRHTPNLGSPTSPHTQQTIAPQRKPLYGNSNTESLSLFSNSGFPVTRHPVGTGGVAALKQHHPAAFSNSTATSGGEEHTKLPTNGPEIIPDTISVSSSTDWQAAFGFQPSMLSSQVRGNGMIDSSMSHSSSSSHHGVTMTEQQQQGHSVQDTSADDDLGFDPWNESTKALQDLIEKEAVTSGPNHLHHQQQQQLRQSVHHRYHNNATQQHNQQMLEQPTSKPIPPGFTPSQLSAFYQNPLLGGSRVLGKLPQSSYPQNGVGMDSLADLALCGAGGPGSLGPAHSQSMPPADSFNMKSWQEGLRALLPNINIHFGNPQAVGEQMHMMNNPPAAGASGLPQQHHAIQTATAHQKTVQQQKSPKNSWDLTCDPAVVTSGNIADGPEEPHWMASLHHLTEDTGPSLQPINPGPQQHNNPYSSRFLPFRQQHSNPQQNSTNTAGGPSFPPTAPPPGFQNSIRPPPHLAAPGMLESRKQLMDAFQ